MELPKLPDIPKRREKIAVTLSLDKESYYIVQAYLKDRVSSISQMINDWLIKFAKQIKKEESK